MAQGRRQSLARSKAVDYKNVAESFYRGAETAHAYEYGNAAGVLIIHAAIAYADAVTIKLGGVKSRGDDHMQIITLLRDVVALDESGHKALIHIQRMIEHKNLVSYSGEIYSKEDVNELWKHLDRFRTWALRILS